VLGLKLIVGPVLSIATDLLANIFPFPASSVHLPVSTLTVCIHVPEFVTTNVYVVPLPLNVPFAPFVTVMSLATKLYTTSLNVNVYVMLVAFVGLFSLAVISSVGAVLSNLYVPNVW